MDLSKISPAEGSVHRTKRIGRGEGSGRGGTSTKGHKGAQARTGYSSKPGFEGGQILSNYGCQNLVSRAATALNTSRSIWINCRHCTKPTVHLR